MPIERPPLLLLGGEEAFNAYKAEFDRLYRTEPIRAIHPNYPEGIAIHFDADRARHVCFAEVKSDRYKQGPRLWVQERAERIRWIQLALTQPDEVRAGHTDPRNLAYLLTILANPAGNPPETQERYGVYIERPDREGHARFCSGYPLDEITWMNARKVGPRLYPPPKPKASKGKNR